MSDKEPQKAEPVEVETDSKPSFDKENEGSSSSDKETKKLSVTDISKAVYQFNSMMFDTQGRIIGLHKKGEGWQAKVEILKDEVEMKKIGREGIVETYLVDISTDGEVVEFERVGRRNKSEID